jgi:hemolysin activation/secretion protein
VQFGAETTIDAVGGDFRYARGSTTLRAIVTPRALLAIAIEGSAGTSRGTIPVQGRFYLGGPATLRGYSGAVTSGDSYWRGRIEIGNSFPAARLMLFTDVGWAGLRKDFTRGKPLIGSGVGASFFDGLVRLDLSRGMRAPTGWRFDLYFDGRL